MTAAALLAAGAAVCYGVSNYIGPKISRDLPVFAVLIAGQVVALLVATILALVLSEGFLSQSAVAGGGGGRRRDRQRRRALRLLPRCAAEGPLSIVAPIGALGTVVPVPAGVASGGVLGRARAGIVLAVAGVALASRPGGAPLSEEGHPVARRGRPSRGLGFGVFLTLLAPAADSDQPWTVSVSRVGLGSSFCCW